ncbi:MAG: Ig domain-containing protein [Paludibacteraceae bacterium]
MKKIFSIFAALLCAGSMMAEQKSEAFDFSSTGFSAITVTKAGTQSSGGDYEFSQGEVTVTGTVGYITSGKCYVYKNGTMVVSVGGAIIDSVLLTYNKDCYPFKEAVPTGGSSTSKTSAVVTVTYVPETAGNAVSFTNEASGKTDLKAMTVHYTTTGASIPVTAVTLDQTTLALMVTEKATLTATVLPENATMKSVQWASSDEEVATVSGGEVVAVGEGTATITATSVADDAISATCTVTVTAKTAPEGAVFFETFDKFTGVGGNDGKWSNINTTPAVGTYDNEGWTAEGTLCAGYACVSIRKNSDTSLPSGLTTPAIGKAGTGKVMFNAESWGSDGTNFFVDIVGGGTFVADENLTAESISNEGVTAKVAMAKSGKWTTFTLSFKDFTATSQLRFYAPANKRAFLDEVVVFVSATPTAIDNADVAIPVIKTIENGQLIILRDGVKYSAMGVRLQ